MRSSKLKVVTAAVFLIAATTSLPQHARAIALLEYAAFLGVVTAAEGAAINAEFFLQVPEKFVAQTSTMDLGGGQTLFGFELTSLNFLGRPFSVSGSGVFTSTSGDFSGSGSYGSEPVLLLLENARVDNPFNPNTVSFNRRVVKLGSTTLDTGPTTLQTQPNFSNTYTGVLQRTGLPDQPVNFELKFLDLVPSGTHLSFQFNPQVDITATRRPGTNLIDVSATIQPTQVIPEPSTWILLVVGALTLLVCGGRRRRQAASCRTQQIH